MQQIKIWAHRGASGYAPENTLEAFELAVKQKADGVELDVHLSKDGRLVVAHDERLERVSDGEGFLKDYTLKELKKFTFNKTHPEYKSAKLPSLDEVYELLKPTGLTVNVEIKTSDFDYPGIEEKLVKLAREWQMEDRVLYSSFNHYSLMRIRKVEPQVKIGLLYSEKFVNVPGYGANLGADALHPHFPMVLEDGYLEACRKNHLLVHPWTVNRAQDIKTMVRSGVDAIITNYPDRAREILLGPAT